MSTGREIRRIEEDDGWWSALDQETGVASQGSTRERALENLDEAVELTEEAHGEDTPAPGPDAPWFDAHPDGFEAESMDKPHPPRANPSG